MKHPIRPTTDDYDFAQRVYEDFRGRPGSEQIASVTALAYLSFVLRERRPDTVLECGSGIGTMSRAMLDHPQAPKRLVLIEDNDFCLGELEKNLAGHEGRYEVVGTPAQLASLTLAADLVIGDGGWMSPAEYDTVRDRTVVFAEGSRGEFRRRLGEHLAGQGLRAVMHNYCTRSRRRIFFTRMFVVPLPWRVIRQCTKKGCWVGEVEPGPPLTKRPPTYQAERP